MKITNDNNNPIELLKIPYELEKNNLLYNIHKKSGHIGYDRLTLKLLIIIIIGKVF